MGIRTLPAALAFVLVLVGRAWIAQDFHRQLFWVDTGQAAKLPAGP